MADGVQLDLFWPPVVDVDGRTSGDEESGYIEYIGRAVYNGNGHYKCLAKINRFILAVVEVKLTFEGAVRHANS